MSTPSLKVFATATGCVTDLAIESIGSRLLLAVDTRARVRLYDCEDGASSAPGRGDDAAAMAPLRAAPLASFADAATAHSRAVTSCAWYPRDGGLFVTGGADGRVCVWGVDGGGVRPAARVELAPGGTPAAGGGASGRVHCVALSPCSSSHALVAVGTDESSVRLLDLATGGAAHTLSGHREPVMCVAWSPVHEYQLASGSRDSSVRLYDVRRSGSTAVLAVLDAHCTAPPDTGAGAVHLGVTGNPTADAAVPPAAAHGAGGVNGLLWASPAHAPRGNHAMRGGDSMLLSTGADSRLRAWGTGAVRRCGGGVAQDDAGDLLRGRAGGLCCWNTLRSFDGVHNRARRCVRLAIGGSPDGASVAVFHPAALPPSSAGGAGAAAVGGVGVWDLATGGPITTLRGHLASVNAVAWRQCRGGEGVVGGGEHLIPLGAALFSGGDDGLILRWSCGGMRTRMQPGSKDDGGADTY